MGRKKESFYMKIVRKIYGITGTFDEYKKQKVNQIGNKAFIFLLGYFSLSIIALSIALFSSIDTGHLLMMYLWCNFLVFIIIMSFVSRSISKFKLNRIEAYNHSDYHELTIKSKHKAIIGTFLFFLVERIVNILMDIFDTTNHLSLLQLIINPRENIIWGIGSLVVGVISYFVLKFRINK